MHNPRSPQVFRLRGWLLAAAVLVGGCAMATGAPDEATLDTPGSTALDLTPPLTATVPELPAATLRPSAEPDAFAVGVERAAAGQLAFAIPAFPVRDGTALYLTVRTMVGVVSGVDADLVLAEDTRCEQGDRVSCALQFERRVASHDGALNDALTPYARLVNEAASDVQVVTWTPVRNGSALAPVTTIQGLRNGRILGIAVFRELPPTAAP